MSQETKRRPPPPDFAPFDPRREWLTDRAPKKWERTPDGWLCRLGEDAVLIKSTPGVCTTIEHYTIEEDRRGSWGSVGRLIYGGPYQSHSQVVRRLRRAKLCFH